MENRQLSVATPEMLLQVQELKLRLAGQLLAKDEIFFLKEREQDYLSAFVGSNIVGFGFGAKVTAGKIVDDVLAVRVYVNVKYELSELDENQMIPTNIRGFSTDVIAIDAISLQSAITKHDRLQVLQSYRPPAQCAISVGFGADVSEGGAYGTLGCIVHKRGEPEQGQQKPDFILSNLHVLTSMITPVKDEVIFRPGPEDFGCPTSPQKIAVLEEYEPWHFMGLSATPRNTMDAAIARLQTGVPVSYEIGNLGRVQNPPVAAGWLMKVQKFGTQSGRTTGVVVGLDDDFIVEVVDPATEKRLYAPFYNQLAIRGDYNSRTDGKFTVGHDSGSLVLGEAMNPIGLHTASQCRLSFCTPIERILDRFAVDIV